MSFAYDSTVNSEFEVVSDDSLDKPDDSLLTLSQSPCDSFTLASNSLPGCSRLSSPPNSTLNEPSDVTIELPTIVFNELSLGTVGPNDSLYDSQLETKQILTRAIEELERYAVEKQQMTVKLEELEAKLQRLVGKNKKLQRMSDFSAREFVRYGSLRSPERSALPKIQLSVQKHDGETQTELTAKTGSSLQVFFLITFMALLSSALFTNSKWNLSEMRIHELVTRLEHQSQKLAESKRTIENLLERQAEDLHPQIELPFSDPDESYPSIQIVEQSPISCQMEEERLEVLGVENDSLREKVVLWQSIAHYFLGSFLFCGIAVVLKCFCLGST